MKVTLSALSSDDRKPVIDIFNYYVENGFAAYPELPLPYEAYDGLLKLSAGYPAIAARDETGQVLGFAMLRPYSSIASFRKTVEISYFIRHDCTGAGIGRLMLDDLVEKARGTGITSILASVSSLNDGSIRFHLKNGFVECGRFPKIGWKLGRSFDVVYLQRSILGNSE